MLMAPAVALAQGILVVIDPEQHVRLPRPIIIWPHPHPTPPVFEPPAATYKIDELEVHARLVDQVAQVQVSQSFVNTGSRPLEVSFIFPLPYEGAIDRMTLMVDGREYPAKLMDAKQARRIYEDIVRKNRDPALLEWMGTGMFQTSVFPVPPGGRRSVTLRYSQLCRKQEGMTDFLFPLSTAKYTSHPVEKVEMHLTIESQEEIKNVYSPSHAVEIKRPDDRHATISYTAKNEVPTSDFRLLYDIGRGKVSTRVLSYRPDNAQDGFFLLLASPEIKTANQERAKKTVMFVIDRSGSMSGKKIDQVKAALKFVLNNLREGDLFNIIAYDSEIESFRPELQRYDDKTRKAAIGFVEGIYAGGSTNIDGALRTALDQLKDSSRPNYVIFLTDGIPTDGETNEMKIIANAKAENRVHARIFVFGVGYDVNSRLLDKLARTGFGQSDFVRPNEDIEDRVGKLYGRIEAPVLTGVDISFHLDEVRTEEGNPVNRIYPKDSFDLFSGEQLVLVGRYRKPGTAKVVVKGSVAGQIEKFDFPATLVEKSNDESYAFIEKLWAVRRVGEILDELDLKGKNEELVKELVELSTRHGILTPYTSFMADDGANPHDLTFNMRTAERRLDALSMTDGVGGVAQRDFKGQMQRAAQAPAASGPARFMSRAQDSSRAAGSSNGSAYGGAALAADSLSELSVVGGDVAKEAEAADRNVRNLGNRTFFRRNGQWVDSQVSKAQEVHPQRIKQFSREYFDLARRHGRTLAQYLVFDEPVLLNLDNQAYLIEP
ncbi:MAG: VIT domain-containing protein [Thermoguttaceae bacterium]|jgi:Ca-activated chloride channel family protein